MSSTRKEQDKAFNSNIILGDQLADKWEVSPHELAYITLKQNLSVLDLPEKFPSKSVFDPNHYKIDPEKLTDIIKYDATRLYDQAFWIPEIQKITDYVNTFPKTFVPRDIWYSTRLPAGSQPLQKKPDNKMKDVIEEHESEIKKNPNVFSFISKIWFVKFKHLEWGLFSNLEKYKYIVHLLELAKSPSEEDEYFIFNSDLISKIKGVDASGENDDTVFKEDLNESDLRDELPENEKDKIEDYGYDLLEKLNSAKQTNDSIKQKRAEEDFKKYQTHISNEYGIKSWISGDGLEIYFKTYFRSNKESEKLRQIIKNQTNNAIKDFKEAMPKLADHLKLHIKTKLTKTVYIPEQIHWLVSY